MPTKIFIADIYIGKYKKENYPVKKLPLNILLSDSFYLSFFIEICGGKKAWDKERGKMKYPEIIIVYKKYLSNINEEPRWTNDGQIS